MVVNTNHLNIIKQNNYEARVHFDMFIVNSGPLADSITNST